jgi:hypothetical protein
MTQSGFACYCQDSNVCIPLALSAFDSHLGLESVSSLKPPDRLWGSPSLLLIGYLGYYPGSKAVEA